MTWKIRKKKTISELRHLSSCQATADSRLRLFCLHVAAAAGRAKSVGRTGHYRYLIILYSRFTYHYSSSQFSSCCIPPSLSLVYILVLPGVTEEEKGETVVLNRKGFFSLLSFVTFFLTLCCYSPVRKFLVQQGQFPAFPFQGELMQPSCVPVCLSRKRK